MINSIFTRFLVCASVSTLFFWSAPVFAGMTIQQGAAVFLQTTTLSAPNAMDTIYVIAGRIVEDMRDESTDFSSSCGLQTDCFSFWLENTTNALRDEIQEEERKTRCATIKAEIAAKNCPARRVNNRPSHDFDINFTFPASSIVNTNFLRPLVRDFQQALWDDVTGNRWFNYSELLTTMKGACSTDATVLATLSVAICKLTVDQYFGQLFGSGYEGWSNSAAATDANANRFGQACTTLSQRHAADQCQT